MQKYIIFVGICGAMRKLSGITAPIDMDEIKNSDDDAPRRGLPGSSSPTGTSYKKLLVIFHVFFNFFHEKN